jgi:hypothetical protein
VLINIIFELPQEQISPYVLRMRDAKIATSSKGFKEI